MSRYHSAGHTFAAWDPVVRPEPPSPSVLAGTGAFVFVVFMAALYFGESGGARQNIGTVLIYLHILSLNLVPNYCRFGSSIDPNTIQTGCALTMATATPAVTVPHGSTALTQRDPIGTL